MSRTEMSDSKFIKFQEDATYGDNDEEVLKVTEVKRVEDIDER